LSIFPGTRKNQEKMEAGMILVRELNAQRTQIKPKKFGKHHIRETKKKIGKFLGIIYFGNIKIGKCQNSRNLLKFERFKCAKKS